jgi:hypothetical protein
MTGEGWKVSTKTGEAYFLFHFLFLFLFLFQKNSPEREHACGG